MYRRLADDLDNYITGHYGEDQFREEEPMEDFKVNLEVVVSANNLTVAKEFARIQKEKINIGAHSVGLKVKTLVVHHVSAWVEVE